MPGPDPRLARDQPPPGNASLDAAFYREGEYWTLAYAGTVCRVRDAKGLYCLAHLLRNPGKKVAAVELLAIGSPLTAPNPEADTADGEEARVLVTKRIRAAVKKIGTHHPSLGHHLDTCIKTGAHCVYLPDPERSPTWTT